MTTNLTLATAQPERPRAASAASAASAATAATAASAATAATAAQPGLRALLRQRIGAELEALSTELARAHEGSPLGSGTRAGRVALANMQGRVRWLGQLLAGLAASGELHLDAERAGFGAIVAAVDLESGRKTTYTLMTGPTIDVSGNQVSMESPVGAALVGALPGDVVEADTPAGPKRLRVDRVTTLLQSFG